MVAEIPIQTPPMYDKSSPGIYLYETRCKGPGRSPQGVKAYCSWSEEVGLVNPWDSSVRTPIKLDPMKHGKPCGADCQVPY